MADHKRQGRNWKLFLVFWALFLIVIGAIGCFVLYRYLGVYEITRPEPVMDHFLAENTAESLTQQAMQHILLDLTEFEDAQELYQAYLATIDTSRPLSYRSDSRNSDATHLYYVVRSGASELCSVVLTPDGDSPGFGRYHWKVSEIRSASITELLPSVTVTVDVLQGTPVYLNGKQITDSYILDNSVPIQDLSPLEERIEPLPSFVRYQVEPLYGEIRVADEKGTVYSPSDTSSPSQLYYQLSSGTNTLTIHAPEDIVVSVNGVPLDEQYVSSSSYGFLEGLEDYTLGNAYRTRTYRLDRLYSIPTVSACDADGRDITPVISAEGSYTFFHNGEADESLYLKPAAEVFFNAYMDYSAHSYDASRYWYLLSLILPGTNLFKYVYESTDAMIWASKTSTEYRDLRYENFYMISDYCFVCTVIYDAEMTATSWNEQYSYELENAYELCFVSSAGNWYAASMNVIS